MMIKQFLHPAGELIRYLDGELMDEDKRKIEAHLASCTECREQLAFARDFNRSLTQLSADELTAREPCPDARTLVRYEAGEVDKETAEHLRAHMLFCNACRDNYYALRRLSREESWRELVEHLKEFVIVLGRTYGTETLVGSVRVVAEQPALARGDGPKTALSKVFEISLTENNYSVRVEMTDDKSISIDVAGVRTPLKSPLDISVRSGPGEELVATRSDAFGNSHFTIPRESLLDGHFLLTLSLKGAEQKILLRV